MDFYVNDVVIEVLDETDVFIHNDAYWERLAEKKELAEKAGKHFVVLRPSDNIVEIVPLLKKSSTPKELFSHFSEISKDYANISQEKEITQKNIAIIPNENISPSEKRMIHFYNNVYMKGRKRF